MTTQEKSFTADEMIEFFNFFKNTKELVEKMRDPVIHNVEMDKIFAQGSQLDYMRQMFMLLMLLKPESLPTSIASFFTIAFQFGVEFEKRRRDMAELNKL